MSEEKLPRFDHGQLDLLCDQEFSASPVSQNKAVDKKQLKAKELSSPANPHKSLLPERLLIVDTETTGLDPEQDHCLEVGAILFHVSSRVVLAQQSFLVPVEVNKAEAINQIPADVTRLFQPWEMGLEYLKELIVASDVLVAHNAAFDKQWFGKPPLPEVLKPWLCTMEDISWPSERMISSRPSVRDLALAYEVPVWAAHRALTDCIYLSEVLRRCTNLDELLLEGMEPRRLMKAEVSYEERHLAKRAGFRWNDPIKGAWTRRLSDRQSERLDFPVVLVEKKQEN